MTHRPPVHWHTSGHGPTLVLINGWTTSGLVWPRSFVERLAGSYRVIRIDNRGSGWSRNAPHPFTMRDLAADVAGVISLESPEPVAVLGFSMGGLIAQELALSHRELVRNLTLVGTRPPAPAQATPELTAFENALGPEGVRPSEAYLRQLWGSFAASGFADAHPEVIAELVDSLVQRPTPRRSVMAQMRAVAACGRADRLTSLQVPTHIVHGVEDPLMPVLNAERLHRLIPHSTVTLLAGVGHLVPQEAGDRLANIVEGAMA